MHYTLRNGGRVDSKLINEGDTFRKGDETYVITLWDDFYHSGYYRVVGGNPKQYFYVTRNDILERRGWERV